MDLTNLSTWGLAGVAAAFAAIGAFWRQARNFSRYLSSFLVLQKPVVSSMLSGVVFQHIRLTYKKAPSGLSRIDMRMETIDNGVLPFMVPYDMPNSSGVWIGKRGWFFVSVNEQTLTLYSIRGISNPYLLIEDAINSDFEKRNSGFKGQFWIEKIIGSASSSTEWNSLSTQSALSDSARSNRDNQALDTASLLRATEHDFSWMIDESRFIRNDDFSPFRGLFFNEETELLISKIKQWHESKNWYEARGLPWRTGVLLYGPGGTGKSSLAKALAQEIGLPLMQFYLNTLTDKEFVREWDRMSKPCVVVLEDIDTVFNGRESITNHKSLSFECLLNQISGVSSSNGIILIVTTNHLDKVDEALGQIDSNGRPTRPGRIDHILYLGPTTEDQRKSIATFVLSGIGDEFIKDLATKGEGSTAAQFQSECIQLALRLMQERLDNQP